tara:strand:- start:9272 stop:10054 length:783 start_codon:yes stop_codon:yes gene_type:complete
MKGFKNFSNTCYFNSSLQCLLQIPVLSNHFIDNEYKGGCQFTEFYSKLVNFYWTKDESIKTLDITSLFKLFQQKFPRFHDNEQHDMQDCVMCIIDILEIAQPIIKEWFYGNKIQETIWPGGRSSNEEIFSMHILNSHCADMNQMLNDSLKWNTIENFQDDKGIVHHVATTRMVFSKFPKILMISFDKKSRVNAIEKIKIVDLEYDLIATGIHVGNQNKGHYVSFTKHKGLWYYKNDEFVAQQDLPKFSEHYLLIYNLKNL